MQSIQPFYSSSSNSLSRRCYVKSSENNTHLTRNLFHHHHRISQFNGSTGCFGFTKSKRGTSYASEELTRKLLKRLSIQIQTMYNERLDVSSINTHIILSGHGRGRLSVMSVLMNAGYSLHTITDATGVNHNGCRPKKQRRI